MLKKINDLVTLKNIAYQLRQMIIDISYQSKAHHIGSALSCIDIITTLYFHSMNLDIGKKPSPNRDRFILSKGHAALAQYVALSKRGFFDESSLKSEFLANGGILGGHPDKLISHGIEMSSGSLGHGLSIAAGVALSAKKNKLPFFSYVLLGDGECNEGMIWEAAMFASHHKLDNLVGFVDYNNLQGLGACNEILNLSTLSEKFHSFGWSVVEIDGNNIEEIVSEIQLLPYQNDRPNMIIAKTIKGKGVPSLENKLHSHYEVLTKQRYEQIMQELEKNKNS